MPHVKNTHHQEKGVLKRFTRGFIKYTQNVATTKGSRTSFSTTVTKPTATQARIMSGTPIICNMLCVWVPRMERGGDHPAVWGVE